MISYRMPLGLTAFLLASAASAGNPAFAAGCESLTALKLPNTIITMAQPQAAGAFTPPGSAAGAKPVPVAFCRVTGSIKPTSVSDIKFELWLPQTGWSGRYVSVGNGGLAGSISFQQMIRPLIGGAAVAGTDDGHEGPTQAGAEWASHPERIIDYGYRAVHLTAAISKMIAAGFYGSQPKQSYFLGCSTGGREGLTEAQRYPEDFDGILAGAPANQYLGLINGGAANIKANLASEAGYISAADALKIGSVITSACDSLDGVRDGLINDPRECRIDISTLPLTAAQLKTYHALHDGTKTSSGKPLYPGLPFGSEAVGWGTVLSGPSFAEAHAHAGRAVLTNGAWGSLVYHDPKWDLLMFDPNKSPADAERAVGHIVGAPSPDLTAFKARGGKLITVHGWADPLITPYGTLNYYDAVVAAQGRGKDGLKKTQDFYRLYMAPGLGHCGGGPGPNPFSMTGAEGDADHDLAVALQRWVEKGVAPDRIIAAKFVDNDPARPVQMTRPLCVYPKSAKYKGTGDTNDAGNFICADPAAK
jgi:hypothetical protein